MYWHIDTDIISLVVIAALYICNLMLPPQDEKRLRNKRFTRCLVSGIAIAIIDIAASVIMETPTPRFLYHLLMIIYFVCIEYVIVEWFLYVLTILYEADEKSRRIIGHVALTIFALYALFICCNPWTGLVYSLGPNNEYSRGPFFSAMLVLYAFYTLVLFLIILGRWKRIPEGYPVGVLLLTPVLIAAGIAVQLSVPGWLMIVPSYMICLVLAFLFLQTMRVKNSQARMENLSRAAETDTLTGLFNRSGMETMARRTLREAYGQNVLVLLVDIDNLKRINDSMGHAEGDRAIRLTGMQMKKHFRIDDTVVRYGGDEFLAFLTGPLTETAIHSSLQRLVDELGTLRVGDKDDVPLHGSVGAAYGIVGVDSFETLCHQADAALYHVKRNGKNGYALYRPEMNAEQTAEQSGEAPRSLS